MGGKTALVLSGGGSRGAYQAGVLVGLAELGFLHGPSPFDILVGASAGSINAAILAAYADRVHEACAEMDQVWRRLRAHQVFRTDFRSMARIAYSWVRDLTFGGLIGGVSAKALLDTAPLPGLLKRIPLENIDGHIAAGRLDALAIVATDYYSSHGVLFVQGRSDVPTWRRARYHLEATQIGIPHLMASSAIPFFFPTVEIGGRHFGDGCIRNTTPLAPAIRLGADRILAVGVREAASIAANPAPGLPKPSPALIAGVLLDAVMLDAVETDVHHCRRINEAVGSGERGFRPVEVVWISPSVPIGPMAARLSDRIPWLVRYLLGGLGNREATHELASYLLFHRDFTSRLMDLGRADVRALEPQLRAFFAGAGVAG